MNVLYIECNMGIAGDMLLSALIDLAENKEEVMEELNSIGIPDISYRLESKESCGIYGAHVRVLVGDQEEKSIDVPQHQEMGLSHEHIHSHDHLLGHDHEHQHDHSHGDEGEHQHDHHCDHGHDHIHGHRHSHDHSHGHAGMQEIRQIIDSLHISDKVKEDARAVYQKIAEAESMVHHSDVSRIHFHEVGSKDAIADIVGCAYMLEKLGADRIIFSPVMTGYGTVRCAHGILPVPAPATAILLQGIPSFAGHEEGEHATPTGVALAGYFAQEFAQRPLMTTRKIGYGMGTKEYASANCVRAFLGEM